MYIRPFVYKLHQAIEPSAIVTQIKELVCSLATNATENDEIQARIVHHATIIKNNYATVSKLIALLEKIG